MTSGATPKMPTISPSGPLIGYLRLSIQRFGSVLRRQLMDLVHAPALGEGPILQPVTDVGNPFRVNVVIGLAHQFSAIVRRLGEAGNVPARGKNHVVAVLDIDVVAGVLDQALKLANSSRRRARLHFARPRGSIREALRRWRGPAS